MLAKLPIALMATVGFLAAAQPAAAVSPFGSTYVAGIAAQTYRDVVSILELSGYKVTSMKSTLLGRVKIRAQNRKHVREVVVSRSTGEVKSDRIIHTFGQGVANGSNRSAASGSGPDSGAPGSGSESGGGISASVGGSGGVNASVGSGGISANVGGIGISIGN